MTNSIISAVAAGTMALSGGGSGLLSVPNGQLMDMYSIDYQHSNGVLSAGSQTPIGRLARMSDHAATDHFQFAVVPRLEFGGRLTTVYNRQTGRRDLNDLSGHFKFQLVKSQNFQLAVGARDLAGEARKLSRAKFAVADVLYGSFALTTGWGQADHEAAALDGFFGGLSYRPLSWLTLMADYDGVATRGGFQLQVPVHGLGLYFKGAHSSDDYQDFHYAVGLQAYLGSSAQASATAPVWFNAAGWWMNSPAHDSMVRPWATDELKSGMRSCAQDIKWTAYNIPVLTAACGSDGTGSWLSEFDDYQRPYNGHLEARIHPLFGYILGSEYGRLDYSLALRGSLQWHMPAGFSVFGVWDGRVLDSDDYRRGGQFHNGRIRSGAVEYAAQYTGHILPGQFLQITGGRTAVFGQLTNFKRVELASHWLDGRLNLDFSYTGIDDTAGNTAEHQRLAKVFAWIMPGRYSAEITRGDFLFGDSGYRAELFAYVGRTRLGVFYKRSFEAFDREAVGMTFNFALTPRQVVGNRWVSLKASPQFQIPIETQINDKAGNFLRPGFLREYVPQRQLVRDVLDRWRMSPSYVNH